MPGRVEARRAVRAVESMGLGAVTGLAALAGGSPPQGSAEATEDDDH